MNCPKSGRFSKRPYHENVLNDHFEIVPPCRSISRILGFARMTKETKLEHYLGLSKVLQNTCSRTYILIQAQIRFEQSKGKRSFWYEEAINGQKY